jgi:hypothetical protein
MNPPVPSEHEPAGAERELAAIAGQDIQPQRRQREDEEGQEDRLFPVFVDEERHHQRRHRHGDPERPQVEADREGRQIRLVCCLELAGFAIEHFRRLLSTGVRSS